MDDLVTILEKKFSLAVEAYRDDRLEDALKLFREVLTGEPRMPEPRLEVATILLRQGALEEAEAQAREAIEYLEKGWRWLDDMTDDQLMAHACNLMAEILKARSVTDEVMKLGADVMREMWQEAREWIIRAAEADPSNPDVMANYYGFKKAPVPRPKGTSSVRDAS